MSVGARTGEPGSAPREEHQPRAMPEPPGAELQAYFESRLTSPKVAQIEKPLVLLVTPLPGNQRQIRLAFQPCRISL